MKKKIKNFKIKRLIALIFFFLPGGLILLSIMMIVNELFINKDDENEQLT